MMNAYRRLRHLVLPVALALGVLVPRMATAEEWVEPKFDPPVGSQWTIQRELNVQKVNGGIMVGHTLKEAALLTIAEKTADGFVVTYARQSSSYDGNPAGAAAQRLMFEAQQGLVIRVVTDAAGKPLRIENFDEVKAALKKAVAAQPASTANPDVLAAVRRVGDRILAVDNKRAAELFLDSLPVLAVAQNTGLKPGEMRKSTLPVANALVDGITKTLTLSIARTNPDAGTARYLMTETYDADSMKTLVLETVKELAITNVSTGTVEQAVKSAVVESVARAQFDVAGGMTRELRKQSVTSFRFTGSRSVTTEDEVVTVTPAETPAPAAPVADAPIAVPPVAATAPAATPVAATTVAVPPR
jgi:hypothetical protein